MFGLLEYTPYACYRYAYDPWRLQRGIQSRHTIQTYIMALQRRIDRMLCDDLLAELDEPTQQTQEQTQEQEQHDHHKQNDMSQNQGATRVFRSSVMRSTLASDRDVIEEHRERMTNEDGSVHVVTRRQIGDRWYLHESHSDKDGATTSKETWHNVSEDAIESFKKEWEDRHSIPFGRETESTTPDALPNTHPEDAPTE